MPKFAFMTPETDRVGQPILCDTRWHFHVMAVSGIIKDRLCDCDGRYYTAVVVEVPNNPHFGFSDPEQAAKRGGWRRGD